MKHGKVYLVGAGPGDVGLATLKAVDCLRRADVIVYDHLANPELLTFARKGAEFVFAGKYPHNHVLFQKEINRLLVKKSWGGKIVVRLKGGDPLLFGRGAEEALELVKSGVPFEIVPGVSSAYSVPAYAGIPVTYRNKASRLNIVTGHETPDKTAPTIPWKTLLDKHATLVIFMGFGNLEKIVKELTADKKALKTPVAVISNGTLPDQEVVTGCLSNIVKKVRASGMKPPALIVVGEVVNLRKNLNWFSPVSPLEGKRVLIARPEHQLSILSDRLKHLGAQVVSIPLIKIVPSGKTAEIREKMADFKKIDVVIFTSVNGVDIFIKAARKFGVSLALLKKKRYAAIGPRTAEELKKYGLSVVCVPPQFVQEALADALLKEVGKMSFLLLVHAEGSRPILEERLRKAGAKISVVDLYKAAPIKKNHDRVKRMFQERKIDAVILTSSSCVDSFAAAFSHSELVRLTKGVIVAVIGPVSGATARKAGLKVTVESSVHTIDGVTKALVEHCKGLKKDRR